MPYVSGAAAVDKAFGSSPQTLASGTSITVDARGVTLSVITVTGGTGNVSRVDSATASGDVAGAGSNTALTAATLTQFKDWGYYRITATSQALRWMLV